MDIWPKLQNFRTKYPSFRKSASVACGPNFRIPSSEDRTSWNDLKMSLRMTYEMECDFIYALIWNQLIWFHEFMMIWWWNRAKLQKGFHWLPWFLKLLGRASGRFPKTLEEKWRDMEGHSNWPKYPDWIFLHFTEANTRDHSKCPSNLLEVPKRFKCSQQVNTNQQQLFETSNLCWFWLLTTQTKIFPSMALASFRFLHQPKIYGLVSMISVILDCQVAFRSWWQQASNLTKALIFLERFPITLFYSHQIPDVPLLCYVLYAFLIYHMREESYKPVEQNKL